MKPNLRTLHGVDHAGSRAARPCRTPPRSDPWRRSRARVPVDGERFKRARVAAHLRCRSSGAASSHDRTSSALPFQARSGPERTGRHLVASPRTCSGWTRTCLPFDGPHASRRHPRTGSGGAFAPNSLRPKQPRFQVGSMTSTPSAGGRRDARVAPVLSCGSRCAGRPGHGATRPVQGGYAVATCARNLAVHPPFRWRPGQGVRARARARSVGRMGGCAGVAEPRLVGGHIVSAPMATTSRSPISPV